MNKTLMLVICDFLLLSMLALARFDPPEEAPQPSLDATAQSSTEVELINLLEESLQAEQASRSNLSADLGAARETLAEKDRLLEARESALEETRQQLETTSGEAQRIAAEKARIEAEQRRVAEEKARVEAERATLAQRFESTREALDTEKTRRIELAETLGQLREESSVARERLGRSEEELIAREIALAEREAALRAAEEEKAKLAAEREALARQLEVARAEQRLLAQNLEEEQSEKELLRQEREQAFARAEQLGANVSELGLGVSQLGQNVFQLGEGVSTIAQTSESIKKEIEEAKPLTMSQIFTRFQNNRALIRFDAKEKGLFGSENTRSYDSKSILVTDAQGTYLVAHTANSPFAFSKPSGILNAVELQVTLGDRSFAVDRIGFLSADPRLIFIPLPQSQVEASGLQPFRMARQPERWEEAVLIKHDESNFGRTNFRRLTTSERFLKMDRPALGELFADFASSQGDLAFTKNSRFIGMLTDRSHAVVVDDFLASAVLELGAAFDPAAAETTLDRLKDRVRSLPEEVR